MLSLIALWPARLIAEETKTNALAKIPGSRAKEYVGIGKNCDWNNCGGEPG